jgi:hypothetical protein
VTSHAVSGNVRGQLGAEGAARASAVRSVRPGPDRRRRPLAVGHGGTRADAEPAVTLRSSETFLFPLGCGALGLVPGRSAAALLTLVVKSWATN